MHPTAACLWVCIAGIVPVAQAPAGKDPASVPIVNNRRSDWIILSPPESPTPVQWAAREWQSYLARMTGCQLSETTASPEGPAIVIGLRNELAADDSSLLPPAATGYDGYSVAVKPADDRGPARIVIGAGTGRGAVYGVYDLLERAGCRWWQPNLDPRDPEVVPETPALSFPAASWSQASPVEFRIYNGSALFFEIVPERLLPQIDWAAKNRYNVVSWQAHHGPGRVEAEIEQMAASGALDDMQKRGLLLHGPGHCFPFFLPGEKYFDAHPEWFGLHNGKRLSHGREWPIMNYCWSNPEANAEFIRNVEEFVRKWPQLNILYMVGIDGGQVCECDRCRARGGPDLVVDLFNQLSDHLADAAPGVILETVIGYGPLAEPPRKSKPNGKWRGLYAHWGRNHRQSYSDADYAKRANLESWTSLFDKSTICSYYAAASHQPFHGPPFLHALQGDADYIVDHGISGHLVLQYPHGFWWNFGFNLAAAGQYAYYHPARRPADQLDDYARTYFGTDAGPLAAEYLRDLGDNEHLEISYRAARGDASPGDLEWLKTQQSLLQQASQRILHHEVYAYRLAKLADGLDMLLRIGPARSYVRSAEKALADRHEGKLQPQAVQKAVSEARAHLAAVQDHADSLSSPKRGVVDAGWLHGWMIRRTLSDPLDRVEKELTERPQPEKVHLVGDGRSHWCLVTRSPQMAAVSFGCEELQEYIRRMSGYNLPVVGEPQHRPAIVIGLRDELAAEDSGLLPPAATGYDGYSVAVKPADDRGPARIVIGADNGRGAVYGVYDLLEKLGCRWFYPAQDPDDPEIVPRPDALSLNAGSWAVASPMRYRICNGSAWFFKMDLDAAAKQLDWAMKARYNGMGWQCESETSLVSQYGRMERAGLLDELDRRAMLLHGPGHAFNLLLSHEAYMSQHPEWFGMRDGKRVPQNFFGAQFCWSNAGARRQLAENTAAFIRQCPQIDILYIAPFDGGKACDCTDCRKLGAGNALMLVMREVIDRLAETAPEVLVETVGGYGPVEEPPVGIEIHPRQRVIWAHWGRYHGFGYGDPGYDRKRNLEAWRKSAKAGITVCQYYTDNFAEPWILPPFAVAMEGDRKCFLETGIDSVYMLMWPPGYWWNHGLNGYLAGRCFYDASLSPWNLIRDYALHYFGPQAGPLLADYYQQWARQVDLAYRVKDNAGDSQRAMLAAQRMRWIDPAVQAAAGDPVLEHRVGKVEKLHALAEQLAEAHRQRSEIQRLRQGERWTEAERLLQNARTFTDEVMARFCRLADLNQGLIERKEIPGFIKTGVQGWLDEEAKAIENHTEN